MIALVIMTLDGSMAASITALNGSGATFPAPLYQRWAADFHKDHPTIMVNYQGIGSGAGITNFLRGLTDFCGSDIAMSDQEITKMGGNIVMIPVTAGTIDFSYNISGVTALKLSREAYVGIFLGMITKWNDPIIVRCNPGVVPPELPVTVVTRSDGSGTTALLTGHLTALPTSQSTRRCPSLLSATS